MWMSRLALVSLAACAGARTPAMMKDVAVLVDPGLDGREAGSEGERRAAEYVEERLRELGLEPVVQEVPTANSRNVYALVEGRTDEVIVVGAHLDHLGRQGGELHPGADDDASGVAAVLAIAETLVARRDELNRSVLVVFFGAEEMGMVGSRHFVEDPPVPQSRMVAMVNIDMIGRPLLDQRWARIPLHLFGAHRDRAVGLSGVRRHPGLRALADEAFSGDGELLAAEDLPDRIAREVEAQAAGRGDSVSFEERGIPALFFGDGESRDYHRPTDTIGRLHPSLLERTTRCIGRLVVALSTAPAEAFAPSEETPPKRRPLRGWYLPFGVTAGAAFGTERGAIWGGEVSLVHLWSGSLVYAGLYSDALRDVGAGVTRVSVGPELGRRWFGIDGGYVLELDDGEITDRGGVVRVFASTSVLSIGLRGGYLAERGTFGELVVLLKYPMRLR